MTKRMTVLASAVISALGTLAAPGAQAAYVVTFEESAGNVLESGSGTLDLTFLRQMFGDNNSPGLNPSIGGLASGAAGVAQQLYFGAISGPTWGPGLTTTPNSSQGDAVEISIAGSLIAVPDGYVSGNHLAESSEYDNSTFASLGLNPGKYVASWGRGASADTFTVIVGGTIAPPPVPEPSTWAMLLLGFAGLGYASHYRRRGATARA